MDPLSELLGGIRAEGAVISEALLEAPWTIRFEDEAPLTMLTFARGGATLLTADGTETEVSAGQTAVVRGPKPFLLADAPDSADRPHTEYRVSCFEPGADEQCAAFDFGEGRWGNAEAGATAVFVGAYRAIGRRHERLLRALPPTLVIDDPSEVCGWLEEAVTEAGDRRPGSQALVDRLFDWGLVCTIRSWFDREGPQAPAWYRGFADEVVGPALRAIHAEPSRPWTVAALAAESRVSRALFARRFTEVMGEAPMSYLTVWRMDLAQELLTDTERTIAQVAKAVGYADAFGFSAAFKRRLGMRPSDFRAELAGAA
ncbi:AraC family transcriptional regulator [Glycomyces xiaoerkulensis]|uniref:AraC family transcriptional regulator n=1 Tax=Glycomyces xiaoerkulensis TaxID=2038139 RepID=UPI000C25FCD9|nr:AraC family transcriptional regulator [Glycomyces xiaoerkulensis]